MRQAIQPSNMTRNQLAKVVARRTGIAEADARSALAAVLERVAAALCEGRRVELRGLGTLRPRYYPGYTGRDPRNGDEVEIPPKVLPAYRPGRELLQRLNSANKEIR